MMESWHPIGVTGIISAFNFPVAVWAWNAALALVCGDPVIDPNNRNTASQVPRTGPSRSIQSCA